MPTLRVCQNVGLQTTIGINASALTTAGATIRLTIPVRKFRRCVIAAALQRSLMAILLSGFADRRFDAPRVCARVLQLCYREVFAMAVAGRKRDIAIRVMVTAKEQAEIRKAANKAAMAMSVYVRAKALAAARAEG